MRTTRGRASLALQLVMMATLGLGPRTARAFGGFYASSAEGKVSADASQVVLMREGTRTVVSMRTDYRGPPAGFALLVPVPVVLQKESVKTLPAELFDRLDRLDAPRLVEYWEQDPCGPLAEVEKKSSGARNPHRTAPSQEAPASDLGVTIEAQFTAAEYEIVILGAKESAGLEAWLHREGYRIPEGSERHLRPYVERGDRFFVARVDTTKVKMNGDHATLSPLRFHYDAPELTLPVRLGLVSSSGTQDLVVHVLGKGQRYDVANYPNVTIPTNLDVAENARGDFDAFYAALFDQTLARTRGAVVTEYAWDAGTCDPCSSPPLTDADLVTLGADVLPSVTSEAGIDHGLLKALGASSAGMASPTGAPRAPARRYYGLGSSFVLTRLHARYTREALGEDLVFRTAPPLVGGREKRRGGVLETGSRTEAGSRNGFQGRYAVRHPWAGRIACEHPIRDRWGGPPDGLDNGGARPATSLAYARRDNVQLASFLRTDVASLDVRAAGAVPSGVGTFARPLSPPPGPDAAGEGGAGGGSTGRGGCLGCSASGGGARRSAFPLLALGVAIVFTRRRRRP